MKAAVISDIHIGPSATYKGVRRKLTEYSETYISEFVSRISDNGKYSFALQLGDLIEDETPEVDKKNFKKGIELFSKCDAPIYHAVGNHDIIGLSNEYLRESIGQESLYYSFENEYGYFIVLHSEDCSETQLISISRQQLSWLQDKLQEASKPTIIFIHHSLADQELDGNPWFEGRPKRCLIDNRKEIRQLICKSGKVVAVINGHLHWNQVSIHDGIPYITLQSAIENFADDGTPANTWAEIELTESTFSIRVFGNDPAEYCYDHNFFAG
jgi:3',5'-cyclic AMP phosphodiesterase CpdA